MSLKLEKIENTGFFENESKNILICEYQKRIIDIENNIKSHNAEIKQLTFKKEMLELELKKLNKPNVVVSYQFYGSKYDPNASLAKNIEYILNDKNYLLTTSEIAKEILIYEPDFNKITFARLQKNIAANLSIKIKRNKIFNKYKIKNQDTLYGLQDWFYPNGEPMKIYYKENQLALKLVDNKILRVP